MREYDDNSIDMSEPFNFKDCEDDFFKGEDDPRREWMDDMRRVIKEFTDMDVETFRVAQVKMDHPEITMDEIGQALRMSRQAIQKRFLRMGKLFPLTKQLINNFAKEVDLPTEEDRREFNERVWIKPRKGATT